MATRIQLQASCTNHTSSSTKLYPATRGILYQCKFANYTQLQEAFFISASLQIIPSYKRHSLSVQVCKLYPATRGILYQCKFANYTQLPEAFFISASLQIIPSYQRHSLSVQVCTQTATASGKAAISTVMASELAQQTQTNYRLCR